VRAHPEQLLVLPHLEPLAHLAQHSLEQEQVSPHLGQQALRQEPLSLEQAQQEPFA
jgi:hypothetical protein